MSQHDPEPTFEGSISITIAPDPRLVRPVRLAMGGLASLAGFDVEAIEDLRVAVNELTATLIERGNGSELQLRLAVLDHGSIRIEGSTGLGSADVVDDRFALSDQILSVVADDHGFDTSSGVASAWLERANVEWVDDDGGEEPT